MMRFQPLGDSAVTAVLSEDDAAVRVSAMAELIRTLSPPGFVDAVPAFGSITVYYDPTKCVDPRDTSACDIAAGWIRAAHAQTPARLFSVQRDLVEIPVTYGGEFGPDLERIAEAANLSIAQVIEMHSSIDYQVLAIGFMPGFAYLGGLPEKLKAPRLRMPRTLTPPGSVGIGGAYTGVYPFASPGGWNLIGRTSLQLFNPATDSPALLHAGQLVRFRPVTSVEVR